MTNYRIGPHRTASNYIGPWVRLPFVGPAIFPIFFQHGSMPKPYNNIILPGASHLVTQSTRHTVNSSQPKIVWRVDRQPKHRVVTSWPALQTPCCHCCDELTACCCRRSYAATISESKCSLTLFLNIVARVPSIPDQSHAHTRIYIKLTYFSSFLFLRRLNG